MFRNNLWVVARRARDVPGQWVAICPNLDLVTQGNSLVQALAMAKEAIVMTVRDDLAADRDPLERWAPKAVWDEFWFDQKPAQKVPLELLETVAKNEDKVSALFVQYVAQIRAEAEPREVEEETFEVLPVTSREPTPQIGA